MNKESVEAGPQEWAVTCGVCHVGGGQMEYDRDRESYSTLSKSGDRYYYQLPRLGEIGGLRDTGGTGPDAAPAVINSTNKAEVDCLMCHLHDNTGIAGNGLAWYKSMGCNETNPIGPMNDPTCSGSSMFPGVPPVVAFAPGTKYDMFNRNLAIKTPSYKIADARFDFAGSMGIGAIATLADGKVTGISGMPAEIDGANIQGTPNSQNCAVCHARDDTAVGLPGMMAMKFGYGNYLLKLDAGSVLDQKTKTDTTTPNSVAWLDFGCKTGMGKRAHKIGAGLNDKWGMSMFVGSTLDSDPNTHPNAGDPIDDKMPDADVHNIAPRTAGGFTAGQPTGIECGTCHYTIGSTELEGGSRTFEAGTHHNVAYPELTVYGIDHQFAQGDSSPDTKAMNNLDGTVSCESCHTTRTHPRLAGNGGDLVSPTPTHAGFPALHIQKIGCTTCHIPETYSAPGRLKYRDWSAGFYKNGQRNMLDWNYDLVTGSHNPVPSLHAWLTKDGAKKIYPFLPSMLPIWVKSSSNSNTIAGSEEGAVFDGTPPTGVQTAVVKTRDVTDVFLDAKANPAYSSFMPRVNQGNMVPLFDNFSLADSWAIDTKAEIDAMVETGNGKLSKLKIFNTLFDVTHGVAPKEWALGGTRRGGCVSCHSSADPKSSNYSSKSAAFFEGYQQPINKAGAGIGQFDLVKNWLALFADYDCTAVVNGLCSSPDTCEAMCTMQMGHTAEECSRTSGFCAQAASACVGGTGPGGSFTDDNLFNPLTGALAQNAFLGACTQMMSSTFDTAMGFPSGSAMQMGMYDGIAGLQGFTIRETTSGSTTCNPFAGPVSFSPMGGMANVNACIPDPSQPGIEGMVPPGSAFAGTCTGPTTIVQGMTVPTCEGGFRNGGPCAANVDCEGSLASPMPLLYTRGEMRTQFKIDLQQSITDGVARVTWPIEVEKNPSNSGHINAWDQANVCVTNPLTGATGACTDGGHIKTTIHANQLLGYTAAALTDLKSPQIAGIAKAAASFAWSNDPAVSLQVNFDASMSTCSGTCAYTWNFGDGSTDAGLTVSRVYAAAGAYSAQLMVEDTQYGFTSTSTVMVTAKSLNTAPVASKTAPAVSGMSVSFTDTSTDAEDAPSALAVTVQWGDGSSSTGAGGSVFSKTYTLGGSYTIKHSVTDTDGLTTSSANSSVSVIAKYSISGTVSDGAGLPVSGATVYLKSGSTVKKSVTTASDGTYSLQNLLKGCYYVVPSKAGITFSPTSQTVCIGPDKAGINFTIQ